MGCNCGGAAKSSGATRTVKRGESARGPNAPGYAWEGPKKRAEQTASKPKS